MSIADVFRNNGMHSSFSESIQSQSVIDAAAQYKRLKVLVKDFPAYFYAPEPKKFHFGTAILCSPQSKAGGSEDGLEQLALYHFHAHLYLSQFRGLLLPYYVVQQKSAFEGILSQSAVQDKKKKGGKQKDVRPDGVEEIRDAEAPAEGPEKLLSDAGKHLIDVFGQLAKRFGSQKPSPEKAQLALPYKAQTEERLYQLIQKEDGFQDVSGEKLQLLKDLAGLGLVTVDNPVYMGYNFGTFAGYQQAIQEGINAATGTLYPAVHLRFGDLTRSREQVSELDAAVDTWEQLVKEHCPQIQGFVRSLPFIIDANQMLEFGRFQDKLLPPFYTKVRENLSWTMDHYTTPATNDFKSTKVKRTVVCKTFEAHQIPALCDGYYQSALWYKRHGYVLLEDRLQVYLGCSKLSFPASQALAENPAHLNKLIDAQFDNYSPTLWLIDYDEAKLEAMRVMKDKKYPMRSQDISKPSAWSKNRDSIVLLCPKRNQVSPQELWDVLSQSHAVNASIQAKLDQVFQSDSKTLDHMQRQGVFDQAKEVFNRVFGGSAFVLDEFQAPTFKIKNFQCVKSVTMVCFAEGDGTKEEKIGVLPTVSVTYRPHFHRTERTALTQLLTPFKSGVVFSAYDALRTSALSAEFNQSTFMLMAKDLFNSQQNLLDKFSKTQAAFDLTGSTDAVVPLNSVYNKVALKFLDKQVRVLEILTKNHDLLRTMYLSPMGVTAVRLQQACQHSRVSTALVQKGGGAFAIMAEESLQDFKDDERVKVLCDNGLGYLSFTTLTQDVEELASDLQERLQAIYWWMNAKGSLRNLRSLTPYDSNKPQSAETLSILHGRLQLVSEGLAFHKDLDQNFARLSLIHQEYCRKLLQINPALGHSAQQFGTSTDLTKLYGLFQPVVNHLKVGFEESKDDARRQPKDVEVRAGVQLEIEAWDRFVRDFKLALKPTKFNLLGFDSLICTWSNLSPEVFRVNNRKVLQIKGVATENIKPRYFTALQRDQVVENLTSERYADTELGQAFSRIGKATGVTQIGFNSEPISSLDKTMIHFDVGMTNSFYSRHLLQWILQSAGSTRENSLSYPFVVEMTKNAQIVQAYKERKQNSMTMKGTWIKSPVQSCAITAYFGPLGADYPPVTLLDGIVFAMYVQPNTMSSTTMKVLEVLNRKVFQLYSAVFNVFAKLLDIYDTDQYKKAKEYDYWFVLKQFEAWLISFGTFAAWFSTNQPGYCREMVVWETIAEIGQSLERVPVVQQYHVREKVLSVDMNTKALSQAMRANALLPGGNAKIIKDTFKYNTAMNDRLTEYNKVRKQEADSYRNSMARTYEFKATQASTQAQEAPAFGSSQNPRQTQSAFATPQANRRRNIEDQEMTQSQRPHELDNLLRFANNSFMGPNQSLLDQSAIQPIQPFVTPVGRGQQQVPQGRMLNRSVMDATANPDHYTTAVQSMNQTRLQGFPNGQ